MGQRDGNIELAAAAAAAQARARAGHPDM